MAGSSPQNTRQGRRVTTRVTGEFNAIDGKARNHHAYEDGLLLRDAGVIDRGKQLHTSRSSQHKVKFVARALTYEVVLI